MLRRRDLKAGDEGTADSPVTQDAEPSADPMAAGAPVSGASANLSPGGLSWKPMRQTNEEWRPGRAGGPMPTGDESVIGPEDYFSGNYRSERGVRVQGRVEGSVESRGHILIEQQAQVSADMNAEDITVAGRYNGKVECRRRFEITPTGIVTGEINTDLLVVQEGGYFDGKLKMKERAAAGRGAPAQPGGGPQNQPRQPAQSDEEQSPAQV